jgi:hypothetical protein
MVRFEGRSAANGSKLRSPRFRVIFERPGTSDARSRLGRQAAAMPNLQPLSSLRREQKPAPASRERRLLGALRTAEKHSGQDE